MNIRRAVFSLMALVLTVPVLVVAQGLVPCGTSANDGLDKMCQTCHVLQLVNSVTAWLVGVLTVVVAILFIVAGFRLVTAAGNPSVMKAAKELIINAFIGFVIVLASWLLIDTLMKLLLGDSSPGFGPWATISCVAQPVLETIPGELLGIEEALVGYPPDQSRGTAYSSGTPGAPIDPAQITAMANLSGLADPDAKLTAAAIAEGLDAQQIRNIRALMRVESGGCQNLVSPAGALGCMQITPGTARAYDPRLNTLSDIEVRNELLNPDYNIALGAKIYADLDRRFDGDETRVHAAYNGGPGANDPSDNCSTGMKWQCEWDGNDCIDGVGSDCTPNTGFIETRKYVQKVAGVAEQLP